MEIVQVREITQAALRSAKGCSNPFEAFKHLLESQSEGKLKVLEGNDEVVFMNPQLINDRVVENLIIVTGGAQAFNSGNCEIRVIPVNARILYKLLGKYSQPMTGESAR